jgi:hypothetical protein
VSVTKKTLTVLDELVAALGRAADYNRDDQVGPAAVLWTDKEEQWRPLLPLLRARLQSLLTLGDLDPTQRCGPAIWVKCALGGALPRVVLPGGEVPVLYLPGVSRAELRAVEGCPRLLQPLAELQYRGVFFSQQNGRDWTVRAFLESAEGGLGLDVAGDTATTKAMGLALEALANRSVTELRGTRLEASNFHELLAPDAVKGLLEWMSDPKGTRGRWEPGRWLAFVETCRNQYLFNPDKDGDLVAAEMLGKRDGSWETAWRRFIEAPERYPGIRSLLEKAEPGPKERTPLFYREDSWPGACHRAEQELRRALVSLASLAQHEAVGRIADLEGRHASRRDWVWSRLGFAPLAESLAPLARLAAGTKIPLASTTFAELAESWATSGWQVDADALEALAAVEKPDDVAAVKAAVRAVYLRWLDDTALRLQELARVGKAPVSEPLPAQDVGTCVLFADGLRLDVGRRLEEHLKSVGFSVDLAWRWAALPTVTATAKPAISPVAHRLSPGPVAEFQTSVDGKTTTTSRFRTLLEAEGVTPLGAEEVGDPSGKAWTEAGSLDRYGHDQGWKLARRVVEEVKELAGRIRTLLDAGWREVRVVTDHGWILVPGGLPTVQLPNYLAESRWGRCASLKEGATPDLVRVPWRWDPAVWVALAPGISTFYKGMDYAHGGLSLQESVVPVLTVRALRAVTGAGKIVSVKWTGLRCKVTVEGATPGSRVDLRQKVADPSTTALVEGGAKPVSGDADVTLFADDKYEGEAISVVLVGADGRVVAKFPTSVGGGAS